MNKPERVILHCAATIDYPLSNVAHDFGAKDIDRWHRDRGWKEIGYHAVIKRNGVIEYGTREEDEYGAHTKGHNVNSLGVCYVGTELPTIEQIVSLCELYRKYFLKHGINARSWHPHNEFEPAKKCPGISIEVVRNLFMSLSPQYIAGV